MCVVWSGGGGGCCAAAPGLVAAAAAAAGQGKCWTGCVALGSAATEALVPGGSMVLRWP